MLITIIAFVVILSILVFVHELGHFLTAKKFGIKVEEFGFGFPPRVFGKKIGETIYSINLLPVGGFVKLYGEDDAGGGSIKKKHQDVKGDMSRAFFARPAWQRLLIVLAGVIMNFGLAVVLISFLFATQGVAIPTENIKILEVTENSPAKEAGLVAGDEIVSVDGNDIATTDDFIKFAAQEAGGPISLEISRDSQTFDVVLTPRTEFPEGDGPLGVGITNTEIRKYPWYEAPFYGTIEAFKFSGLIAVGLAEMVGNIITGGDEPVGVAGPVGVAQLTGQAVSYGIFATLWFVALLSLNLAVVNVLPIPALDGGRLFFILIEMVTRRKVSPKYEAVAHGIGLVLLLSLIVFITFFDVIRLMTGQSLLPEM